MPGLFVLMLVLLYNSMTLEGWGEGFDFLFGMRVDRLTGAGVLEALGHAFFTLSLGMGAMITYGSYLKSKDDLVAASLMTAGLDTLVALVASMVVFPIAFTFALEPGAGPGLIFVTIPTALAQMPAGAFFAMVFFVMLVLAALTSAISILEVVTAYLVDDFGLSRKKASLLGWIGVVLLGAPSAVSAAWFGQIDYLVSNWLMPVGGFGVAVFVALKLDAALRRDEFERGSALAGLYRAWLWGLKYPVPAFILLVFLHAVGVLELAGIVD